MLSLKGMQRLYLALSLLALTACSGPSIQFAVITKTLTKSGANYSLKLEYPEIVGAPGSLNKQIVESALIRLEKVADSPIPLDEFAKNVAGDKLVTDLKRESITTVAHKTDSILTTRCQTLDGAYYEVYDRKTGRRLEFEDIVEPGKLPPSGEPNLGLLANGIIYNGAETPYSQLKGVLKPQFLP